MTSPKKGVARVFDLLSRRDLFRIENIPEVWDLAISPDRTTLALSFSAQAPADTGQTQIWSIPDRRKIATLTGGQNGTARFSDDGAWLKISGRGQTGLWATKDWSRVDGFDFDGNNLVFQPGSNGWVAGSSFENIIVWNRDGSPRFNLEPPLNKTRYTLSAFRLAISPDGTLLAALSSNNILLIWNLQELDARLSRYGLGHNTKISPSN